jgi:hypothetical protein
MKLGGTTYPLKIDKVAPITTMSRRGRDVARSGFRYMLGRAAMQEKPGIYLTEPYDANKLIDVRSGHSVCQNPNAQREVMRILRLEVEGEKRTNETVSVAER